ncbi:MAG: hypothetical protein IIV81_00115 [Clostridia bacterium]|nr:hypothetical protein [Clostridia bacterium]
MKRSLAELWNGEIHPCEDNFIRKEEEKELSSLIERNKEKLERLLNEEGKSTLSALDDCIYEMQSLIGEEAFINGFSLAVRIMSEAITK